MIFCNVCSAAMHCKYLKPIKNLEPVDQCSIPPVDFVAMHCKSVLQVNQCNTSFILTVLCTLCCFPTDGTETSTQVCVPFQVWCLNIHKIPFCHCMTTIFDLAKMLIIMDIMKNYTWLFVSHRLTSVKRKILFLDKNHEDEDERLVILLLCRVLMERRKMEKKARVQKMVWQIR